MSDQAVDNPNDDGLSAGAAPAGEENLQGNNESKQPAEKSKPNGYEKRIATLVHRERQKDQENAQLKAELETLKATKTPAATEEKAPELPSEDLRYDNPEQYKQELDAYNRHVARQEFGRLESERQKNLDNQKAKEQADAQQERHSEIVKNYIEGGIASGISEDKMMANERMLQQSQIDPGLAEQIYSDEHGARIVDYLADNPDKLSEMAGMNPFQAAVKLANEIKPQALSGKPTSTNAPDPIEPTVGGGMPPGESRPFIKGAKFE